MEIKMENKTHLIILKISKRNKIKNIIPVHRIHNIVKFENKTIWMIIIKLKLKMITSVPTFAACTYTLINTAAATAVYIFSVLFYISGGDLNIFLEENSESISPRALSTNWRPGLWVFKETQQNLLFPMDTDSPPVLITPSSLGCKLTVGFICVGHNPKLLRKKTPSWWCGGS